MKKRSSSHLSTARYVSFVAMFSLLALGLSYLESLIPPLTSIPGIKLGLANIAVIFVLYKFDVKGAASVSLIRVFISFLLFGSLISLAYSFSGALISFTVMIIMKKSGKFSVIGVSVAGAITHNIAQITVAALIFSTKEIIFYLPVLVISAVISGTVIGGVGALLVKKVRINIK